MLPDEQNQLNKLALITLLSAVSLLLLAPYSCSRLVKWVWLDFEHKLRFYNLKQMGVWTLTGLIWQAYNYSLDMDCEIRKEILKDMSDKQLIPFEINRAIALKERRA